MNITHAFPAASLMAFSQLLGVDNRGKPGHDVGCLLTENASTLR